MRSLVRLLVTILVLIGCAAVVVGGWFAAQGISAKPAPGRIESALMPRLREFAIPSAAKNAKNPVPATPESVKAGMDHFADHCAICHGNDGSGNTEMGRHLYPRVPDMRLAKTQNMTDGEIFYIIENGVKLTGMPAWEDEHESGDSADSGNSTWKLVNFIRHLPKITPDEVKEMEQLNPKAPDERGQPSDEDFLKGADAPPKHKHGGEGK